MHRFFSLARASQARLAAVVLVALGLGLPACAQSTGTGSAPGAGDSGDLFGQGADPGARPGLRPSGGSASRPAPALVPVVQIPELAGLEPLAEEWAERYRRIFTSSRTQTADRFKVPFGPAARDAATAAAEIAGEGGRQGLAAMVDAAIGELSRRVADGSRSRLQRAIEAAELVRLQVMAADLGAWCRARSIEVEVPEGFTGAAPGAPRAIFAGAAAGAPALPDLGPVQPVPAEAKAVLEGEVATLVRMARSNAGDARARLEAALAAKQGGEAAADGSAYLVTYGDPAGFARDVVPAAAGGLLALLRLKAGLAALALVLDEGGYGEATEPARAFIELAVEYGGLAWFVDVHRLAVKTPAGAGAPPGSEPAAQADTALVDTAIARARSASRRLELYAAVGVLEGRLTPEERSDLMARAESRDSLVAALEELKQTLAARAAGQADALARAATDPPVVWFAPVRGFPTSGLPRLAGTFGKRLLAAIARRGQPQ